VLRLTDTYQKAVAVLFLKGTWALGFQEWGRRFVVENMQRSTGPFLDFVPNFSLRESERAFRKDFQDVIFIRTSPPAAKLGAGVEKSPGPSLFMGF
jgi:hypothetical protein